MDFDLLTLNTVMFVVRTRMGCGRSGRVAVGRAPIKDWMGTIRHPNVGIISASNLLLQYKSNPCLLAAEPER